MNPNQNPGQYPDQNNGQLPPMPQPNQPQPVLPQVDKTPYDFILNPEKPPKKPITKIGGNSMLSRIAVVGGGLAVLAIIAIVFFSILGSGGKAKAADLLAISQYQTEVLRIAADGSLHATAAPTQNLAQGIQVSVMSDAAAFSVYAQGQGVKFSPADVNLKKSKAADAQLAAAQENNTYDVAFKQVIQADLTSYMNALQKAYSSDVGSAGKKLLSAQYDSADALLKLSKQ